MVSDEFHSTNTTVFYKPMHLVFIYENILELSVVKSSKFISGIVLLTRL
jgi:hypothetical protein